MDTTQFGRIKIVGKLFIFMAYETLALLCFSIPRLFIITKETKFIPPL